MDQPEDSGGRSGIFPRVELRAPQPAEADAPTPPPRNRPAPTDAGALTGEPPVSAEGEDTARDESEADPEADAP